jgi:hypothetical protein
MKTAVEWFNENLKNLIKESELTDMRPSEFDAREMELFEQAKEMEKEQMGYSEEDVRLAYFQGEKDSYVKGGQTKEMEDEFIQSLKQTKQQEQ